MMKLATNASTSPSTGLRTRLSTRLTILFVLLSISPLAVVGYLAYDNGQRTIEQDTHNRLISTTILKEAEFNRWVEGNERSLRELARRPTIGEYAAVMAWRDPSTGSGRDPADPEYQAAHRSLHEDHLNTTLEEERGFLDLSILRDDGLILCSTDEKLEGKYKESEPYFVEGKSRTYVQNAYYSLTLGEAAMAIGTPIEDKDGNLIAVLAGHVDLAEMSEIMMQRSGLSASEETYLVNKFNFFVTESRFEPGYALKKALHTEGVEACLAHNDGVGFYDDYRGVPVIGAYRWMPERELCILTEVDQAEAFAPIVALRKTVLGIGVGVALVVAALGLFFARTITGPLRQLVKGAQAIGRGDLETRIEVRARDEIGQLAGAFNEMAADLRRSLGQTVHSQHLVLALSQAAQAVQRARTPEEVYHAVGDEVFRLGYNASVFALTEDRSHLAITYLNFQPDLLRAAEKLSGLSAQDYRFPLTPGGFYQRVMTEGKTVFSEPAAESIAEAMPKLMRPLAGPLVALLNIRQAIYAPLTVGGERFGLLTVTGADLTEADVPAVTTFANQAAIALENTRAAEVLRESEAKYRNLTESLDELIYRADPETFVATYVNRAVERIYGYTVEEFLGDPTLWESTIHPEDKERVFAWFTEPQRKMESGAIEYRIISTLSMKFLHKKQRF